MPKTFQAAPSNVDELIIETMKRHHQPLMDLGVTIAAVFVSNENKHGQCGGLKHNGLPAAAKIRITPLEDRARGNRDAKLVIDDYAWSRLNEPSRVALIDHELEHLQPNPTKETKKKPARKTDDLGRPRLKLKPHSYELAGFTDVVQRHGEAAIEVMAVRRFVAEQLPLFPAGTWKS